MELDLDWLTDGTMMSGSRLFAINIGKPSFQGLEVSDVKYIKKKKRLYVRFHARSRRSTIMNRRSYNPENSDARPVAIISDSVIESPVKLELSDWFGRRGLVEDLKSLMIGCFIPLNLNRCTWYSAGRAPLISRYGKEWCVLCVNTRAVTDLIGSTMFHVRERINDIVMNSDHAAADFARLVKEGTGNFSDKANAALSLISAANNYSDYDGVHVDKGLLEGILKPKDVSYVTVMNRCRSDMCGFNLSLSLVDVVGYDDFMSGKYDYSNIESGATPEEIYNRIVEVVDTNLKIDGQSQLQLIKCRVSARTPDYFVKSIGETEWKNLKEANVL